MRSFTSLFLAAAVSSVASAQSQYYIDPNSVNIVTRQSWCTSQTSACPLICLQTSANSADTYANTCDAETLSYSCVCSNGITPNASEYSQTLPYFTCTQFGQNCVAACGSDNLCASNCRANHPCGAQNPTRVNLSTVSTTMSKTASSSGNAASTNTAGQTVYNTGFGAAASSTGSSSAASTSSSTTKSSGALALEVGQAYGLFVVAAGMFGGFAFML